MAETMTMGTPMMKPGLDVYTSDGDKIGAVKEVRGMYFKVDAKMQPDYWLETACVSTSTMADRVMVTFDKDHLGDMKRELNDDGTPKTDHK